MEVFGPRDGAPGEHLGVSHMLKHYLSPSEVWEDFVTADAPNRPWVLLDEFDKIEPPLWRQWESPSERVRELWDRVWVPAYRHGYLAVVRSLAAELPASTIAPWRSCPGGSVCATPAGVVLIVNRARPIPVLRTAFRPLGVTIKSHRAVPMDATSKSHRAKMARSNAKKAIQLIGAGGRW